MEDVGPAGAIFALEAGLGDVAGDDVSIEAGIVGTDEQDEAEIVSPGKACLAGLYAKLERGIVEGPSYAGRRKGVCPRYLALYRKNCSYCLGQIHSD